MTAMKLQQWTVWKSDNIPFTTQIVLNESLLRQKQNIRLKTVLIERLEFMPFSENSET